jgi:site-specific DNA-cytosine methylase
MAKQIAYNMDCMEAMREMPDKAFELAIVDPPYGIGIDGQKKSISKNPKHNRKEHEKKGWDTAPPDEAYFRELERVSKNQVIWGGNYFVPMLSRKDYDEVNHLLNICNINGAEVEPVDVVIGGSPCQDLSVAGKRAGLDGERSGLFKEDQP